MSEIKLTGTLKTYKAVIVWNDEKPPEGYHSIAGGFVNGMSVEIAIPESLVYQDFKFANRLAVQAERCLFNASNLGDIE